MLLISFFGSLIGVSIGIFVGSLGKMKEGGKIGIILGFSMVCSFLSGLMNNTMKDLIEKICLLLTGSIQQHLFLMLFTASMCMTI